MITLAGTRALVTGGSRGVGAAVAQMLAEAGADVAIGYQSRSDDAQATVRRLQALGVKASACGADIATVDGAEALVAAAVAELGGIDIFVGNAGIWPPTPVAVDEMSSSQWSRTVAVNLDSIFFTTRAVLRHMSNPGRIVLVTSTAGQRGEAFHADYAATKGAIISFVKSVAVEVAARGITVNGVAPGWIDTEMIDSVRPDGGLQQIAGGIPVGRVASAADIAGPILFLCSSLARHVTGEILNVNGGSVLCG